MKVTLNKIFPLDGPIDASWSQLQDIESVANCMPGAEITEKVDDTHYKGKVKLKVGPMNVAFHGTMNVQNIDDSERALHVIASGKDAKGTSSASMDLSANIAAGEDTPSTLIGNADVIVNGKLANFGGRMMTQIADQILQEFANNFNAKLQQTLTAADNSTDSSLASDTDQAANTSNDINIFKFVWSVLIGFILSFFKKLRS